MNAFEDLPTSHSFEPEKQERFSKPQETRSERTPPTPPPLPNSCKDSNLFDDSYRFSLLESANGEQVPVFPYTISILGHLNLNLQDGDERSAARIRETLRKYLLQVIRHWERKAGKEFPLILMLNLLGDSGKIMTELAFELQETHPCLRLMALLPMAREFMTPEDQRQLDSFYPYFDPKKPENAHRYLRELQLDDLAADVREAVQHLPEVERVRSLRVSQWRRFNEMCAIHSHLMIVLWRGTDDPYEGDDSLKWIVRLKLDGFSGNTLHSESDLLTYPAIGPVLHILTDTESLENPNEKEKFLPTFYYWDGVEITEEKNDQRVLKSHKEFPDLSTFKWLAFLANITLHSDIHQNIRTLGIMNRALLQHAPSHTESVREFTARYIKEQYDYSDARVLIPGTQEDFIPDADKPTKQLIHHFRTVDEIAMYFRKITNQVSFLYSISFLIIFWSGSFFTFLSTILFRSHGLASYQLFPFIPKSNPEGFHNLYAFCWSHFFSPEWFCLTGLWISFLFMLGGLSCVAYCYVRSLADSHHQYHRFRALAESLRIQIYWRIGGLDTSVPGNFRSHQIETLDWLRIALNSLDVTVLPSHHIADKSLLIRMVDKIWIEVDKKFVFKATGTDIPFYAIPKLITRLKYSFLKFHESTIARFLRNAAIGVFILLLCSSPIILNYNTNTLIVDSKTDTNIADFMHTFHYRLMLVKLIYELIAGAVIVYWARQRMNITAKKLRMREQLRTPYMLADYLLDTIWNDHHERIEREKRQNAAARSSVPSATEKELAMQSLVLNESELRKCQVVLHQLGQEVLAKYADWLLAATERDLKLPR